MASDAPEDEPPQKTAPREWPQTGETDLLGAINRGSPYERRKNKRYYPVEDYPNNFCNRQV